MCPPSGDFPSFSVPQTRAVSSVEQRKKKLRKLLLLNTLKINFLLWLNSRDRARETRSRADTHTHTTRKKNFDGQRYFPSFARWAERYSVFFF